MRVATYARYSSDLQDKRSIVDQESALDAYAHSRGWSVVAHFSDAAASGSSIHGRKGLADCIAAGRAGRFDGIIVESLDRISRSLADTATLHRDLVYAGIKLLSAADGGELQTLMLAVKGGLSEQFIVDLRQKVKRGQMGRVRAGRIPGGRCYGYDVPAGEDRGRRVIDESQAATIRRIFQEYADGRGPIAIVADLNREGVPGPRGGKWNASTLVGSRKRANGILQNSLYVGKLRFERQRFLKDPATGKRQARPNAESDWVEQEMPDLRIVPDALWSAVQARRAASATSHPSRQRRPKRVLSGLLRCGVCGGTVIVVQGPYVGCSNHSNKRTCDNRRLMPMEEIEQRVLEALRTHLLSPERIELAIETYRREREARAKAYAKDRRAIERELADVKRGVERVMNMIVKGMGDPIDLGEQSKALASRRRELEAKLPLIETNVVSLHPQAAIRYRQKVEEIQAALTAGDSAGQEAVAMVRSLIDRIVITPQPERMGLEVFGDLAILLGNVPSTDGDFSNAKDGCGGWI